MKLPVYTLGKEDFVITLHSTPNLQYYFTLPVSIHSGYTIFIYTKEQMAVRTVVTIPMSVENILKFIEERNEDGFNILDKYSGVSFTTEEFIEKYKSSY